MEIRDPTGDNGKVVGETVKENQRDSITGTVQDLVADEVVTRVEETGKTAEAAVRKGPWFKHQPSPPPRQAKNLGWRSELSGRR